MQTRRTTFPVVLVLAVVVAGAGDLFAQSSNRLDSSSIAQIQALMEEKNSRTPAQQKVDSNLLYESKQRRGLAVAAGVAELQTGIEVGPAGGVVVDIVATKADAVLDAIAGLGGKVLSSYPQYRSIRAELPIDSLETLAEHSEILFIQPKQQARYSALRPETAAIRGVTPSLLSALKPGFPGRAAMVRSRLAAALAGLRVSAPAKTNTSEGVVTHRADLAISTFGANGAGVKVGVLSDGVKSLAALQASGDLPPVVTVLPGQAGPANGDEGSAMLEIVYDMAPGAQLFFATADNGTASFANNIRALRTAGCDVIVDDVTYFVETPFQKGQAPSVLSTTNGGRIIQAVNDVTASGALYFSSSANSGAKDKNFSGTWEGDFADGGPTTNPPIARAGRYHDFDPGPGVATFDTLNGFAGPFDLFWSDPLGGSANDYDLYLLRPNGTLFAASTNVQNGTQDPFEFLGLQGTATGYRLVIVKVSGADRFLHMDTFAFDPISFSTQGSTHGHNAPPNAGGFGVAATPAAAGIAPGPPWPSGPYPNPFNSSNTIEPYSSDGPRRFFFNADSSPITAGNFSSTGGQVVQQPLVTAADGTSVATPGFNPFFGTSAAAPHAGAIAALVKSRRPSLAPSQITNALLLTAIDIEGPGVDRNSGFGILDAFNAVKAVAHRTVSGLSPARVWVGLKNSDDQGTQFDLRVEILKNGTPVASGLQRCITGLTRNPGLAKETNALFGLAGSIDYDTGDVLALRVSTRIGTNPDDTKCGTAGSHNSAVGLRLYYDASPRASHFDATISPDPSENLYLHSDGGPCGSAESAGVTTRSLSDAAPVGTTAKCKDSGSVHFTGGNPFSEVGTWSLPAFP